MLQVYKKKAAILQLCYKLISQLWLILHSYNHYFKAVFKENNQVVTALSLRALLRLCKHLISFIKD